MTMVSYENTEAVFSGSQRNVVPKIMFGKIHMWGE
jgi:hypothetical protein